MLKAIEILFLCSKLVYFFLNPAYTAPLLAFYLKIVRFINVDNNNNNNHYKSNFGYLKQQPPLYGHNVG